jgi:hypothetical protein
MAGNMLPVINAKLSSLARPAKIIAGISYAVMKGRISAAPTDLQYRVRLLSQANL